MPEDVYVTNFITKRLILKEDNQDRYFEGILSVEIKDRQGEITSIDELYKALPAWIDRGGAMSDTHSNRIVGKGINFEKITVMTKNGVELPGIKILGKIHKSSALDDFIWDKIKSGEYKGLSFGGATKAERTPVMQSDGSMAYALKDLEIYEVAVCEDPAVAFALITDVNPIAKTKAVYDEKVGEELKAKCDGTKCYINATVTKADLGTPIDQDDVPKETETLIGKPVKEKGYNPEPEDDIEKGDRTYKILDELSQKEKVKEHMKDSKGEIWYETESEEEEKAIFGQHEEQMKPTEDKTKPLPTKWGKMEFEACESHAKKDPNVKNPGGYCGSIQQHVDKVNEGQTGVGNQCKEGASCSEKPDLSEAGVDEVTGSNNGGDRDYFKKSCGCKLKDIVGTGTENPRGLGAYNTSVNGSGGSNQITSRVSEDPKTNPKKKVELTDPARLGDPEKLENSPSKLKDPMAKSFLEAITEYWRENKTTDNNTDLHNAIKDFISNFKPEKQAEIAKAYIGHNESEWVADAVQFSKSPDGLAQYGKNVEVDKSGNIVDESGNVIFINPFI